MTFNFHKNLDTLKTMDATSKEWLSFMTEYVSRYKEGKYTKYFDEVVDNFSTGLKFTGVDDNMVKAICLILEIHPEDDECTAFQHVTGALYSMEEEDALFKYPDLVCNPVYAQKYFRLCPVNDYIKVMYEPYGSLVRNSAIIDWVETFPYFLERFDDSYFLDDFSKELFKPMLFPAVCFKLMEYIDAGNTLKPSTLNAVSYVCAVHCIEPMYLAGDYDFIFSNSAYTDMLKSCDLYVKHICGKDMYAKAMKLVDSYKALGVLPKYSAWHILLHDADKQIELDMPEIGGNI